VKKGNGVLSNLIWKFAERITAQLVSLVVSVILARLLNPSDYGTIAIVMIFITIANVFVSDGWGSALIQKKDADELDFYSCLYFTIGLSIFLYFVLFLCAPFISAFYGEGYEILTPVLRVLGLRLILSAINSVQQAAISRKMQFRMFFWATLLGTIISAFVGIWMAYNGFGVWALVAQYMINTTVDTIVLAFRMKIKPKLMFSFIRLKSLLNYGWKILGSRLLLTGYQEIRSILIGKIYSSEDLAFYDKGKQFPSLIVTNIDSSIGAVLFPKLSQIQDDKQRLKETTRMSIRYSSYLLSPMMFGLAAVSTSFVTVLLTPKWLPCVPLMQMMCILYLFQPINTANLQAIKAVGKSSIVLILEIIKILVQLCGLLIVLHVNVKAIVLMMTVLNVLLTFVNIIPNKKYLNYGVKEQFQDILPAITYGLIMFFAVSLIGILPLSAAALLLIQIVSGIIIYIALSIFTHNREFKYLSSTLMGLLKR
jgi:O-antigen/teichoic acid export membrane protein